MLPSRALPALFFRPLETPPARLLGVASACALIFAMRALLRLAVPQTTYLAAESSFFPATATFAMLAVAGCAVAPRNRRPLVLFAASAAAYPFLLGAWAVGPFAYAVLVCLLARSGWRRMAQITAAVFLWAAGVVAWHRLDLTGTNGFFLGKVVWVGLCYSTICLLIERSRTKHKSGWAQDLFYLLALPRLLNPFFQPLSPTLVAARQESQTTLWTLAQTVGLAGYAMGLRALAPSLARTLHSGLMAPLAIVVGILYYYCEIGQNIFTSVSLFRLIGVDLPSGFHRPFLSRSFGDFFARYNYYVRNAVFSLFFAPLFIRLRHRLPQKVAVAAAAYLGIFLGSFVLNELLVPLALSPHFGPALAASLTPRVVLAELAYWSAIVLPPVLAIGRARAHRAQHWTEAVGSEALGSRAAGSRAIAIARFLLLFYLLQAALWTVGHRAALWQGP